jgi:hypothetical protein
MTAEIEQQAIKRDAGARLLELRKLARALYPDRDDAEVMSELTVVIGQIRQAERELGTRNGR